MISQLQEVLMTFLRGRDIIKKASMRKQHALSDDAKNDLGSVCIFEPVTLNVGKS